MKRGTAGDWHPCAVSVSIERVEAAYDASAKRYAELFCSLPNVERKWLSTIADRLPGCARVLDAGCGTGTVAALFAGLGHDVAGIDISRGLLAIAREREPQVLWIREDIRELPPELGAGLDLYVAWYSLVHLTPNGVADAFASAKQALRPGGLLAVVVHEALVTDELAENLPWVWTDSFLGTNSGLGYRLMRRGELQRQLSAAGFDPVESAVRRRGNPAAGEVNTLRCMLLAKSSRD